jgi:zinc/manganese transport system substrate-binding protein
MLSLLIAVITVAATPGCTTTKIGASKPGQITVVATTTQMQDMVRNVGGGRVHLVGILKPNVDPHDFEPTPGTAVALSGAKLIVESGIGVDSWADQLVESEGMTDPTIVIP